MTDFRLCSARQPCSQAGLCHCTRQLISDQPEPTIARLRYHLGGDRPSQTTRLALSAALLRLRVRNKTHREWYFTIASCIPTRMHSPAPTYPTHAAPHFQTKV